MRVCALLPTWCKYSGAVDYGIRTTLVVGILANPGRERGRRVGDRDSAAKSKPEIACTKNSNIYKWHLSERIRRGA